MEMIVCVDLNWGIGNNNQLLFHLKKDMELFKQVTMNKTVLMGRKTHDSLPKKPLPNRRNVILTSESKTSNLTDVYYENSIEKVVDTYDDIVCVGGSSIYEQCLKYCDIVYVTKVLHSASDVDSYFPNIDKMKEWKKIEESDIYSEVDSEGNDRYFQFTKYCRV